MKKVITKFVYELFAGILIAISILTGEYPLGCVVVLMYLAGELFEELSWREPLFEVQEKGRTSRSDLNQRQCAAEEDRGMNLVRDVAEWGMA